VAKCCSKVIGHPPSNVFFKVEILPFLTTHLKENIFNVNLTYFANFLENIAKFSISKNDKKKDIQVAT
jgi:hypothetical protein